MLCFVCCPLLITQNNQNKKKKVEIIISLIVMHVKIPDSTAEMFLVPTQIYRVSSGGRKRGCSSCQCRYIPCNSDCARAGKHQGIPHLWPKVMTEHSRWSPGSPSVEEAFPEPLQVWHSSSAPAPAAATSCALKPAEPPAWQRDLLNH